MRVFFFFALLSFAPFHGAVPELNQIDFDWLAYESEGTEYVATFDKIFEKIKPKTLLEFGVHYSTKYFLESSKRVVSVEFVTHGYGPETLKEFIKLYKDSANWVPIAYFSGYKGDMNWAPYRYQGSDHVYKAASYQTETHKSYAATDNFYLTELKAFIGNLVKSNKVDVGFVHPAGVYLRGDIVQLMFDKIPIIVAHETKCRANGENGDVFGYDRIQTPENYEEIYLPYGKGTTVWVAKRDEWRELAQAMRDFAVSFSESAEEVMMKIPDIRHPTSSDYRRIQNYLSFGNRPYLDWLYEFLPEGRMDGIRLETRFRMFKITGEPVFEKVYFNEDPENKDLCIISYASRSYDYPEKLKRLKPNLKRVGFKGHLMYRIGGWPDAEEGGLALAHVPYAFKVCMFNEARKMGYKKILWLDSSFVPLQKIDLVFDLIQKEGYLLLANGYKLSQYANERMLHAFGITPQESGGIDCVAGGIVGFDFTNPIGAMLFENWKAATSDLEKAISPRSDQNALAAILYNMHLPPVMDIDRICMWQKEKIRSQHLFYYGP